MVLGANAIEQVLTLYRADDRPWVVGFSGGKDSTALLQLVFQTLRKLNPSERSKPVHVVCNDTLVEIPQVAQMVAAVLIKVEAAAKKLALPITVAQTRPELEDTFFVNIIGRGYVSTEECSTADVTTCRFCGFPLSAA